MRRPLRGELLVPLREPFKDAVGAPCFSAASIHDSLLHGESIASLKSGGSSRSVEEEMMDEDKTGILKTRLGEVGGLVGGEAIDDAYELAI